MTAASSSPRPDHQRVVVTGLGAITNLGRDVPTIWSALQSGKSGIDTIQCFDQAESVWSCKVAGEVRDWTPAPVVDDKAARRMDRYCQLAMWAAEEAVQDSGFDFTTGDPYRHGVVVGSGIGGISTIEQGIEKLHESGPRRISPFTVPRLMLNSAAGNISIRHGLKGPNSAIGTACHWWSQHSFRLRSHSTGPSGCDGRRGFRGFDHPTVHWLVWGHEGHVDRTQRIAHRSVTSI